MMSKNLYAHTKPGSKVDEWQKLEDHLTNVAEMALEFGSDYGGGKWAYFAGLWHDLGKSSNEFQAKLIAANDYDAHVETKPGRVDHSTAGAQHAYKILKDIGKILAYTIAGHHAGLPDGKSNEESCLAKRLEKKVPNYNLLVESNLIDYPSLKDLPIKVDKNRFGFQISFFIRMLYSCLVDADFLDTERFVDEDKSRWRSGYELLAVLQDKLNSYLDRFSQKSFPLSINNYRNQILNACLEAAEWSPGLFSLTVPTGGGKTLSSLAFAFKHALAHGKARIIYVIPYTSIIEQNAAVFREILGDDAVLEHHSNYDSSDEDYRSRLAAENWDAPLIVTTNVQFFESLFSNRSSRCRKIHRIANSVVILDEAQMLPVSLLKPCLEAIRELSLNYGTSTVLCTATQPALLKTDLFPDGLEGVREIIPEPSKLYSALKRVQIKKLPVLQDAKLVQQLQDYPRVLCIVNTRKHAREVFEKLPNRDGCFHLSGLMCPAHRTEVLERVKSTLLNDNKPCRVVSTQLVEAGVDVDFPVVFRAISGIDSIAQAAGRCNREGKLGQEGKVFVFSPESGVPPGDLRQATETAESILRNHDDPLSLTAVNDYFRMYYWLKGEALDRQHILADLNEGSRSGDFPFKQINVKFRIIETEMQSLIIPFNQDADAVISELRYSTYPAAAARKAQRFTIQVYPQIINSLLAAGSVEQLQNQYLVLINRDLYRDDLGLCPEDPMFHEIESLIC